MKTHWMLIGLTVAGLGLTFIAKSQEPAGADPSKDGATRRNTGVDPFDPNAPAPEPMLVQVQVEHVEMSHQALTKLLYGSKPVDSNATKLREQVQDMVGRNEAMILDTQIVVAKNGQKATTESIHEFVYPTEYEPPKLPGTFSDEKTKPEAGPDWTLGPVPTAYETRNLGSTLEIEPTICDDGQIIDLRFIPEMVWHTGDVTWHEGKDRLDNRFHVRMPDIYTLRLNTALTCASGKYALAGVVSPKDDKGEVDTSRKVMIFVKCDILAVK